MNKKLNKGIKQLHSVIYNLAQGEFDLLDIAMIKGTAEGLAQCCVLAREEILEKEKCTSTKQSAPE